MLRPSRHRDRSARGQRVKDPLDSLGSDQRRICIENDEVTLKIVKGCLSRLNRVAGPLRWVLQGGFCPQRRARVPYGRRVPTINDHALGRAGKGRDAHLAGWAASVPRVWAGGGLGRAAASSLGGSRGEARSSS